MADNVAGISGQVQRTTLTIMTPMNAGANTNEDSPSFVTPECRRMFERSQVTRDLSEGIPAIDRNIQTYLPRHPNESDDSYSQRKRLISFRNWYAKAKQAIEGKIFAQPPALKPDVPGAIREDLEDANLNGDHWTVVAKEWFSSALDEGISWLLVDHRVSPGEDLTLAQERELGLRPYWVVIPQHQMLGVEYLYENGVFIITQFRYVEWIKRKKGRFGQELVEAIRVVEPDQVETFERVHQTDRVGGTSTEDGQWQSMGAVPNTLGVVAAVPLNLNRKGRFMAYPCLEDLAYMNVEHFQVRSDQRRALAVASFPMLVVKGVSATGTVQIGPMTSTTLEDPGADMQWVESKGVHLKAGRDEIKDLEEQIRLFSLSFENPQMYATATGRNIDSADAIAPIQMWALMLRDALEMALKHHASWRKLPDGGSVDVNTSFIRNMITVEMLQLLVEALKEGAITPRSFMQRLKEYGLLSDDYDPDIDVQEAVKLGQEKIKMMAEAKAKAAPPKPGDPAPQPGE